MKVVRFDSAVDRDSCWGEGACLIEEEERELGKTCSNELGD